MLLDQVTLNLVTEAFEARLGRRLTFEERNAYRSGLATGYAYANLQNEAKTTTHLPKNA